MFYNWIRYGRTQWKDIPVSIVTLLAEFQKGPVYYTFSVNGSHSDASTAHKIYQAWDNQLVPPILPSQDF